MIGYRLVRSFGSTALIARALLALALLMFSALAASAEMKIQEVVSSKGVRAWLVEDYSVPVIAMRFAFEGGSTQDPVGKEGLANLMTALFDEGAGPLDSDAFQIKLDDAGAEMGFDADRDRFEGGMRMLADQREEAFNLLALAVNQPRFDQNPIDRMRAQIISGIVARSRDPEYAAGLKWGEALYPGHPYSRRSQGMPETLKTISADDLRAFHKNVFAREKLHVGVVGAIDAETLKKELDRVFGDLPEKPNLIAVPDVAPKLGQTLSVTYDLPQTIIQMAYPGVARADPEFFAAFLMNHILGGGSFTSRLFEEVREKRGLAYGVDSSLSSSEHSNLLSISTATRSDRASETLDIMRTVIKDVAENGVTDDELAAAKKYVIGAYAINNLNSSAAIARTLVELQAEDLGIDYMQRRGALIDAVTREQVNAIAKKLLTVDPAIMTVGPEKQG
ncbi:MULTISPECIES: M16 family metallopeptidase [Mesorhizobium]|nr:MULTISPECIES: pitrilysin family protein [Mesorhizobium]